MLVAISWTVAACFPFSGNSSLFPPAVHNGGCRLDLIKEQLPWFGEFENVSGRGLVLSGSHAAFNAFENIWRVTCFPQISWCQNGGAFLAQR